MAKTKKGRKSDRERGQELLDAKKTDMRGETVDSFGNAPKRGMWLIHRGRERVYGQIKNVRRNGNVEWFNPEHDWTTSRGAQHLIVSTKGTTIHGGAYEYSHEIPDGFSFIDGSQPGDFDMAATTTTKKTSAKKTATATKGKGKAKAKPAKRKVAAKPQTVAQKLKAKAAAKVKAKAAKKTSAKKTNGKKAAKKPATKKAATKKPMKDYSADAIAFVRKNKGCTTMQVANALAEKHKDLQSSRGKRYNAALKTLDALYADGRLKYRNAKTSEGRTGVVWTA